MRRPRLNGRDLRRAVEKLGRIWQRRRSSAGAAGAAPTGTDTALSVISPLMLPFSDIAGVHRLNTLQVQTALKREIRRRNFQKFCVITTLPTASGVVDQIGADKLIYYCTDDWTHWPELLHGHIKTWEEELVAKSDLVVATAKTLQHRIESLGARSVLLPHGVDVDHFAKAQRPDRGEPRRVLTYFGLIDQRTDFAILRSIASARPHIELQLIGPAAVDLTALLTVPNIKHRPGVPYADLPAALRTTDVLLLPYQIDQLAQSINPLKIRECLATGKPVVAMALPEVAELPGIILAPTAQDFVSRCLALVDQDPPQPHVVDLSWLRDASWEARADDLARLIADLRQ